MTSVRYLNGRRKYSRPQAVLWSDNQGTLEQVQVGTDENSGTPIYKYVHVPLGFEVGALTDETDPSLLNQFLVLSDDNRNEINVSFERIENRQRMLNGRMRSYHIADKRKINLSWEMLPSRSFFNSPDFNTTSDFDSVIGKSTYNGNFGLPTSSDQQFTTDGGAGGAEILDWYNSHPGSFWMYLSYDNYKNFNSTDDVSPYQRLQEYGEVVEVFFSNFEYSVVKRGGSNFDFWIIDLELEEV